MTFPVVLFVCTHYYPFLCTIVFGDGVGSCMGGGIVSTWLAMGFCRFRRLALVLYMCTSETFYVIPLCGYGIGGLTSVSSRMIWGSVWGCYLFARPGVIVIFAFLYTL